LTAASDCRKFKCAPGGVVDPNDHNICAKKDASNVVTVGDCRKFIFKNIAYGMTCDMNDKVNSTIFCHRKMESKKLAGQKYVYSPKECFTSKADPEGYCRGNLEGEPCSNNGDAECDVDLYCRSETKRCTKAAVNGEFCNRDTKCASYLLCIWEYEANRVCREYGIYPNGKLLGPYDEDNICQSNYVTHELFCADGPLLIGSNLRKSEGEECIYTRGDPDQSYCWYHSEGKAICKRGARDLIKEWRKALEYLAKKPKCHVSIPMGLCDMGRKVVETEKEWKDIWLAIIRLHWESHLEGLAPCMRQYIHPEAFKYMSSLDSLISKDKR